MANRLSADGSTEKASSQGPIVAQVRWRNRFLKFFGAQFADFPKPKSLFFEKLEANFEASQKIPQLFSKKYNTCFDLCSIAQLKRIVL